MSAAIAVLQLATWAMIWAAAVHLLRVAAWGWRAAPLRQAPAPSGPPAEDQPPLVTVQLPMRNERTVAERAIRGACALDWPRDRLQVQVLDDSDDDTSALVDRVVAERRAAGDPVEVLRRTDRAGFKAGNLEHGLATARGEYVAVLDADAVPPAELLRRLIAPLRADPSLAFTQARWSFHNERASLLTRVQALVLHALFVVEQSRLSALGRPLPFNGTAGVWRRRALDQAGGWMASGARLAEDLDLSYRASLQGLRGLTLPEVAVQTELPASMAAFVSQQVRWVRGGGQTLRALLRSLVSGSLRPEERATMLGHLLRHARQPLLALMLAWLPLSVLGAIPSPGPRAAWSFTLGAALLGFAAYLGAALRRLGRSPLPALLAAPLLLALSLGLCLPLAAGLLAGVLLPGRGAFQRTPKTGGQDAVPLYRARPDRLAPVVLVLGFAYQYLASLTLIEGDGPATLALGGLVGGGLLWVGLGSLRR